jgi:hypothetical protein
MMGLTYKMNELVKKRVVRIASPIVNPNDSRYRSTEYLGALFANPVSLSAMNAFSTSLALRMSCVVY